MDGFDTEAPEIVAVKREQGFNAVRFYGRSEPSVMRLFARDLLGRNEFQPVAKNLWGILEKRPLPDEVIDFSADEFQRPP